MEIKAKEIKVVEIDSLILNPKNCNKHSDEQIEQLAKIIQYQGFRNPVTVSNRSGFVVAGHGRIEACKKIGMKEVPVIFQDFENEAEEYAHLVADNAIAAQAELDLSMINTEVLDLGPDFDVTLLGLENFVIEPIEKLPPGAMPDADIPLPKNPISRRGDVWILGPHRVLCGDSTSFDDVEKLMNGEKASMIFTDPPWNVNYGADQNHPSWKARTIKNDHMDAESWSQFVHGFCSTLFAFSLPGAPIYLVMSAQEWPVIDKELRDAGFHWSSTIIWAKDRLVLSRKDYHTQYEPIWYGWNEGAARLCPLEDRTQSDLWNIERPSVSELHPTTKPVELIERAVNNSCVRGGIVLDLFGGSGSTLMGAHACGKAARLCELDEKYVDVIVRRWAKATGQDPFLEESGKRLSEFEEEA